MLEFKVENAKMDAELRDLKRVFHKAMEFYSEEALENVREEYPRSRASAEKDWTLEERDDLDFYLEAHGDIPEWLYRGTGIYGVHHSPIQPTHAKALVFFWNKIGEWTAWKGDLAPSETGSFVAWALKRGMRPFLRWPRGMPGDDYIDRAMTKTEDSAQRCIDRAMRMSGMAR